MPERRYRRGCGKSCHGCWQNNMKHGNSMTKKFIAQHPDDPRATFEITGDIQIPNNPWENVDWEANSRAPVESKSRTGKKNRGVRGQRKAVQATE